MILAINYADDAFKKAQKFNKETALKIGGVDKVIEYGPADIDEEFKVQNKHIFSYKRGAGYWLWKPYIILKALKTIDDNDYLIYADAGAAYVNKVSYLIDAMERDDTDIMCFCINQPERKWSKRDALILMEADSDDILDSRQICATYIVIKKTKHSMGVIEKYLSYAQDARIVTDEPNVMGVENYPEFVENRHDQTVWSLLCKKEGIKPYKDPSQFGLRDEDFPKDVVERSTYPQVLDSHRKRDIKYYFELQYATKWYQRILRFIYGKMKLAKRLFQRVIGLFMPSCL